jgi:hypothetical protein
MFCSQSNLDHSTYCWKKSNEKDSSITHVDTFTQVVWLESNFGPSRYASIAPYQLNSANQNINRIFIAALGMAGIVDGDDMESSWRE